MKRLWILLVVALLGLGVPGRAAEPAEGVPGPVQDAEARDGLLSFLLPKSLQRNPRLNFNIITEFTPEGRKVAKPTAEKPAYYIVHSTGVRHLGLNPEMNLKAPTEDNMRTILERALAENHYLPSAENRPPSLVILLHMGSHSFQPPASVAPDASPIADPATADPAGTGDVPVPELTIRKTLLDRAQLLGGATFLKDVAEAMEQTDRKASLEAVHVAPEGGADYMGSVASMMRDPFDELRSRSPEYERLVDELFSSSFFVVASAFDYAAMAQGRARLLWRTRMTVNALGVNMIESLPPLLANAAPYLGRETPTPVVISKRVPRGGKVEVGPAVVIESDVAAPAKPPADETKK